MSATQREIKEPEFTDKEIEEIQRLQGTIDSRGASKMEKQIAEATLESIARAKQPPAHNRRHRINSLEEESARGSGNIYRQDEAFEKYEMGNDQSARPENMAEHQAVGDLHSVKFNHKARGTAKAKKADSFHEELP
ncbi:hypothetical protein BDN70DRAFT_870932 [Pholiota conissans]|uniref:Uncharacterized protein n=1 Tax=Pholiota conissans TaxID=109636 RepID=A0A9P6D6I9_9AGAR|nr:hypothetical protein BDN70DRAFT_870932 [Pholiota conissans]